MKSILETIQSRSSRRTYKPEQLSDKILKEINNVLQNCPPGPFKSESAFKLIHKSDANNQRIKLGTYGFISGAQYFIAGKIVPEPDAFVDFGYRMEWIILQLTALGLGSCWLGGTFTRGEFSKLLKPDAHEVIPAVTPVGLTPDKRSLRDRLIRLGAGSKNRKLIEALFFDTKFNQPLINLNNTEATVLEMVRLAPSASNKQPWRIVRKDNFFHFYLQRTPGYGPKSGGTDLQKVDLGIAICHFDLAAQELGWKGVWSQITTGIAMPEYVEYIISWEIDD